VGVLGLVTLLALAGPAIDSDGDGIPDDVDKCPGDAETYNGYQDSDGCPDVSQPRPGGQVPQILERVAFAHESAELKPASFALLDALGIVIKNQPEAFPTVALEGHAADNERTAMKLSLARASTVRLALIARGVDASRLLARASGTTAPVCTERSEGCRARERTVEFVTIPADKPAVAAEAEKATGEVDQAAPAKPAVSDPIPLERIEFKKSSAAIGPAALPNLDILAGFMKGTPVSLEIVGYADRDERRPPGLATARAEAVRAYLRACGVSDQHLNVRAESGAKCRSRDEACHGRNRRAELRFVESAASK
jgi:outer membrane protein OmpA-like peptidoglycan-associated protein